MTAVILVGGLPGTGKSTLAEMLAQELRLPLFSKDRLEASVVSSGIADIDNLQHVGYHLIKDLVDQYVAREQSVILDFIGSRHRLLTLWPGFFDLPLIAIECACSDTETHKARLESRRREISGWYELTWSQVAKMKQEYEPAKRERLVLDSMASPSENVQLAFEYISNLSVSK